MGLWRHVSLRNAITENNQQLKKGNNLLKALLYMARINLSIDHRKISIEGPYCPTRWSYMGHS